MGGEIGSLENFLSMAAFNSSNFCKYDELNASIDRKFSNDPISPPISTNILGDKLSNNYRRDLYTRYRLNLATESVNPVAPNILNHGLSAVNVLDKSTRIWIPNTRNISFPDVTHWSMEGSALGKGAAVGDDVVDKSDYSEENNKTDFEIWMENYKLQFESENIERS